MIDIYGIDSQPNPLDGIIVDYLLGQKSEMPWLDFKYRINVQKGEDFPEIAKDVFAMANYGGGYIVAGVKEKSTGSFEHIGLPMGFHIDQAIIQEKFNSFTLNKIELLYREPEREVNGVARKFPVIYVPPSRSFLVPSRDGEYQKADKIRIAFRIGQVFIRRGTQSVPATSEEIKRISERIGNQIVKPSVLSGNPDSVNEILFGNLLKVTRLPSSIFMGKALSKRQDTTKRYRYPGPHVVVDNHFYSFLNLSRPGFRSRVDQDSITRLKTDTLLDDESDQDIIVRLLNSEIRNAGHRLGLYYQKRRTCMYFPIRNKGDRIRRKKWPGRYRESTRTVAKRFTHKGRSLYYHPAVQFRFAFVGDGLYLQILPRFVLTHDGYESISDSDSGTAITSLSYRQYNTQYLLNILFWISLLPRNPQGMIELNDRVGLSDELVQTVINVGISGDLPVRNQARELEEHFVDVVKPRRPKFQSTYLGEPDLLFGHGGIEKDPRIGMKEYGPYIYSDGTSPLSQIRIGIVGTGRSIQLTKEILDMLGSKILSVKPNKWLFPSFPGFSRDNPINCEIIQAANWIARIPKARIDRVLQVTDVNQRIADAASLFTDYASKILMEDTIPAVLIYALPKEIEEFCGISERTRGAKRPKVSDEEKRRRELIAEGQTFLTEWGFAIEEELEDVPRSYDLWAAMKGRAMDFEVPIQILQESTCREILDYSVSSSTVEPPSSYAWNLSTGLYYKASGRPWRLAKLTPGTCYVGVSLYRSRHEVDEQLRIAMAQVFTHSGEGFVLRGGKASIQERTKEAHMKQEQAFQLISEVISQFTKRTEAPPSRVVIHKSSYFMEEELQGFAEAIGTIPVDYIAIRPWSRFRFLRSGKYPVLRGTLVTLTPNDYLIFTHGYSPRLRSYPGHRVPSPLLVQHRGDTERELICREILGLTKLDWNTTSFNKKMPITLAFANRVGLILAEFPEDKKIRSHYKYYM